MFAIHGKREAAVYRTRSSVVVLALSLTLGVGCASTTSQTNIERHVVPNRLVHASLEEFEIVSFVDVDLHTAVQTREAVETEFHSAYGRVGHLRWFFHAFDEKNLDFIVARFEPADGGGGRYKAERRLRVRRTRDAERALGISAVVREHEIGTRGVKPGMSTHEVTSVAGDAEARIPHAEAGSFDLLYPTFCVRFRSDRVERIWKRDVCS